MTGGITKLLSQPELWAQRMARGMYARRIDNRREAGLYRLKRLDPIGFAKRLAEAEAEARANDPGCQNVAAYAAFVRRRGTKMRRLEAEGLRLLRAEQSAAKKAAAAA